MQRPFTKAKQQILPRLHIFQIQERSCIIICSSSFWIFSDGGYSAKQSLIRYTLIHLLVVEFGRFAPRIGIEHVQ
jgi:hypothetical protein